MIDQLITIFIKLMVVIDPFAVLPIFIGLTGSYTLAQKRNIAFKATLIGTILLFVFAVLGDLFLDTLGISVPSFRIAGGILLLIAAIDMVVARHSGITSTTPTEDEEAAHRQSITVFPLAIPLIAGPGAMTTVTILMREADTQPYLQAGILAILFAVLVITYVMLYMAPSLNKILGVTGTNVITRVFGIILAAFAVQLILDGIKLVVQTMINAN